MLEQMKGTTASRRSCILALIGLLAFAGSFGGSSAVAVMSIDIGSEWMKVAIVSPGVPMEIALNKESKRKTPVTISFRNGERTFGEDAQAVGVRFPQFSFSYILDLLGKSLDNPMVRVYKERFPYHDLVADEERKTVAFRVTEGSGANLTFTPEELLAQILKKGKEFAEISAGQKINEAVLTVPGFFNQAERKALLQAAELAGIKVLQLINDYTAVALNYGIFRRKEINDSAHYVLFFDMGASKTTATVVGYQNVKVKERGYAETNPQVSILGVGYDRTLGGLEMQVRLRNYLAREFDATKRSRKSVFENPRAMAKLFKEAGRVKNVLSANLEHFAQVEGLLEEQDFKLHVTREKYEELCADLFERLSRPIAMALDASGLSLKEMSHVVLVGAGTRMPKVQEVLTEHVATELSKNINTDEAAALGAVYKAADLSQGFKVKKFVTKDAVVFPIQIVFDRNAEGRVKQVKRTLFSRMNAYPQKKIITFNKHTDDFEFSVNYAELDHLSQEEILAIGNLNITKISLKGVADALAKHANDAAEIKGIKAHFSMDESGILNLLNVELVSEKTGVPVDEEEGTFSKLGSTISKLFSGSDDKEAAGGKVEDAPKDDIKPVHEEPEYPEKKETEEESKKSAANDTKPPAEEKSKNKTEKVESSKEKKPTILVLKEPIQAKEIVLGSQIMVGDKLESSREKIRALDLHDEEKARRETALNNLEAFVIDAQQKLESDEYKVATTPEEAEKILKACSETSEWLYDEAFDANAEVYEEKLNELKKLTNDLYERVYEHRERPEALKGMFSMLNGSRVFLNNMKNLSLSSEVFTQVEIETLEKTINETQEYYDLVNQHVTKATANEPVKYKVRDIANKMVLLDREVNYLLNKAKIWKPKQESSSNQTDNSNSKKSEVPESSGVPPPTDSSSSSSSSGDESSRNETVGEEETVDKSATEGSGEAKAEAKSAEKSADESRTLPKAEKLQDEMHQEL